MQAISQRLIPIRVENEDFDDQIAVSAQFCVSTYRVPHLDGTLPQDRCPTVTVSESRTIGKSKLHLRNC
jgi:hypothetical protein